MYYSNIYDFCNRSSDIVNWLCNKSTSAEVSMSAGEKTNATFTFDLPFSDMSGIQAVFVKPTFIKHDGKTTIVYWNDGSFTAVRSSENEGTASDYFAFCAALAKKIYGTNSSIQRMITRASDTYIQEQKEKAARKRAEENAERERIAHERAVRRLAKKIQLQEEARQYYDNMSARTKKGSKHED